MVPMPALLPNSTLLALFLGLSLAACQSSAPPPPPPPPLPVALPVVDEDPCRPEAITELRKVMSCQLAPFATMGRGDEASFRKALAALKGMVPEPAYAREGDPANWVTIVEKMEQSGDFKAGCRSCHQAWKADYGQRFRERKIR